MGLNITDVKRIAWTFVMSAGAVLIALALDWFGTGGELNWKVWAIAALAAGISAVKNAALQDGNVIK